MKIFRSTLLMIIFLLFFSFSVFNGQPTVIRFFSWRSPEMPLFLVLIFVFALGFALALIWNALRRTGKRPLGRGDAAEKEPRGRNEMSSGRKIGAGETPSESSETGKK